VCAGYYGKHDLYTMQVIHNSVQHMYTLFTRWGRVGEQGQFQKTPFASAAEACHEFEKVRGSARVWVWVLWSLRWSL
jgi:predicted DNA-binding WGR domain protein